MALSKVAIGIDLGTTSSAVGVWRNGKVEIIPNNLGHRTTPSYIAFTGDGGRLVGDAAVSQLETNPSNTVWGFKSLLGKSFDDTEVQEGIKYWPFQVINVGRKPSIEVEQNGETKRFTPEELTSLLLLKLRHTAEAYLGQGVTDAVITIPACSDSLQVAATKRAAELAGLNVLVLISDPTAAALAFIQQTRKVGGDQEKNILVVNVGEATTGMSVLTLKDTSIKVRATDGNTNLGGLHLDNKIMQKISAGRPNLTKRDSGAAQRLRAACGRVKRVLSSDPTIAIVGIQVAGDDGRPVSSSITQDGFSELCLDLFQEAVVGQLDGVFRAAQLERSEIHEILLVGGSSRIPKMQSLLQDYFRGKELNKSLHPDEAHAHGAAILAAILRSGGDPLMDRWWLLEDVTPFCVGVQTTENFIVTLIPGNSPIPARKTCVFTTAYDDQSAIIAAICEGDTGKRSSLLGTFFVSEIPPPQPVSPGSRSLLSWMPTEP